MVSPRKKPPGKPSSGELRLIGGQWKRTKLTFPALPGVRPTPSRVRETVFNWLQADIADSVCVDLFAGSGALGFEALSRGAKHVWFVDQNQQVCDSIKGHIHRLQAHATLRQQNALNIEQLVTHISPSPDIIFCDPPFQQNLVATVIANLQASVWLTTPTLIYIETEASLSRIEHPENWELRKQKQAGEVIYRLFQVG